MFPFSSALVVGGGNTDWQCHSIFIAKNCTVFVNGKEITSRKQAAVAAGKPSTLIEVKITAEERHFLELASLGANWKQKFLFLRLKNQGITLDRRKHEYFHRPEYNIHLRFDRPLIKNLSHLIDNWDFDIFQIDRQSFGRSCFEIGLSLFHRHNLLSHFSMDIVDLRRTLLSIEQTYHNTNPYHTARHAADVAQAVHCLLMDEKLSPYFSPLEILASILAALCHDADHPGLNQAYLIKTHHHLASLYQDRSVLENHHYRVGLSILQETSLLKNLSTEDRKYFFLVFRELILATDISQQGAYLARFSNAIEKAGGSLDLLEKENRLLVLQMVLKCGDICNPVRVWPLAEHWANLVVKEFYRQGDLEREQHMPVMPMMNKWTTKKAKIQVDFIRYLVLPLFGQWNRFLHSAFSEHLYQLVQSNFMRWQELEEEEETQDISPEPISALDAVLTNTTTLHPGMTELTPLHEEDTMDLFDKINGHVDPPSLGKVCKRMLIGGSCQLLQILSLQNAKEEIIHFPPRTTHRRFSLPSNLKCTLSPMEDDTIVMKSSSSNNSSSRSSRSSSHQSDNPIDTPIQHGQHISPYFSIGNPLPLPVSNEKPNRPSGGGSSLWRRSSLPYTALHVTPGGRASQAHQQRNSIAMVTSYLMGVTSSSRRASLETTFHFPPKLLTPNGKLLGAGGGDGRGTGGGIAGNIWNSRRDGRKKSTAAAERRENTPVTNLPPLCTTAQGNDLHDFLMAALSAAQAVQPSYSGGIGGSQRRGSAPLLGLAQIQHQSLLSKYQQNRRCSHSDIHSGLNTRGSLSRHGSCSSFGVTQ